MTESGIFEEELGRLLTKLTESLSEAVDQIAVLTCVNAALLRQLAQAHHLDLAAVEAEAADVATDFSDGDRVATRVRFLVGAHSAAAAVRPALKLIQGGKITHDDLNIGSAHRHGGIERGGAKTNEPGD